MGPIFTSYTVNKNTIGVPNNTLHLQNVFERHTLQHLLRASV